MPIPSATKIQQTLCESLANAIVWLFSNHESNTNQSPHGLIGAYFQQWLNGLVYELYFPSEMHERNLFLCDETTKLRLRDLNMNREKVKLSRLREVFETAYDSNSTLRTMLHSVRSLEVVRIIEDSLDDSDPQFG